jgi:hypothetical protein
MAKSSESKKSGKARAARRERRFEPKSTHSPALVKSLGALGAAAMGAGAYGQFGHMMRAVESEPVKFASWILAGGAVVLGGAIWLGTSGDAALRVGDPGVSLDRSGGLRRMPWHAVERVALEGGAVRVEGKDDLGTPMTVLAPLSSQAEAAAWIVREARARVPALVEIERGEDDAENAELPEAHDDAGERMIAEPAQLVGRHCAASGKIIAYEPDARMCRRCERVYHKAAVPSECECGASLADLQAKPKVIAEV